MLTTAVFEIITLLSITGYGFAIKFLMREDAELSLFSGVSLVVALVYVSSLLGILKTGSLIVFVLGLFFLILAVLLIVLRYRNLFFEFFTPGIVTFLVLSAFFIYKTRGYTLSSWDEFSHWGLMTKDMYQSGALSTPAGPVTFWYYSPGANLFQYFFTAVSGFKEHTLYFAQFVLLLAPIMVFFRGFSFRRHALFIIITIAVFYTLVIIFFQTMVSIMVDQVLGVYFGMAAAAYFRDSGGKKSLAVYIPVLFALTLFKASGFFFAVVLTVMISGHFIVRVLRDKLPVQSSALIITVLAFALSSPIASTSWKMHIKHENGGQIPNLIQSSKQSLIDAVKSPKDETQREIVNNFLSALKDRGREVGSFNIKAWFILFMCLFATVFALRSGYRGRVLWVFTVMAVFFVIYLTGILKVYLFNLGPYEGKLLASFERYTGTYLLSFSLVLYGFILPESGFKPKHGQYKLLIFYVLLTSLFFIRYPVLKNVTTVFAHPDYEVKWFRHKLSAQIEFIKTKTLADSKVFIVFLGTTGFEHRVISYELIPRRFNMGCWSIGKPFFEGDIWSCELTIGQWYEQLSSGKYDYVYLATPHELFWRMYGDAFDNSTKQWSDILFKANYELNGGKHFLLPQR